MNLRKADSADLDTIWGIIRYAIEQRRLEGSRQWQDGYPNPASLQEDLDKGNAYVLEQGADILLYAAVIFDGEPAYEAIEGRWLGHGDYLTVHRVAASPLAKGKGVATELFRMLENFAVQNGIYSIRVDTNFDNLAMLRILEKLGYVYCGEVVFRGGTRKAFEKLLPQG